MTRYVALLRGINVGSHHRITMPVLKGIATDLGYDDPATYLQSGNLAFTARAGERTVASALATAITASTGFEVPVVLRNHKELTAVVADNPLPVDPKLLSVIFSSTAVTGLGVDPDAYGEERLAQHGREAYLWTPGGIHASKLAQALARKGARDGTVRNWRTVQALVDLTAPS